MALFVNDEDERRTFVRVVFNRELGREPTYDEQTARAEEIRTQGADIFLAQIRDSSEAQQFRQHRGW